jgi:hypothetical protein
MTATILFQDDFSTSGKLNSTSWHFNQWTQNNNASFLGKTQMRQELPIAQNGMARIEMDTFNPANADPRYRDTPSFLGSEAITNQAFSLPGNGGGIAFEAKFKFEGTQGGMIAGLFSYQNFPLGQGQKIHDEIDYEILTTQLAKVSTNVFGNSDKNIFPLSVAVAPGTFSDWHTYRMEWFPDHITWFVDGNAIRTVTNTTPSTVVNPDTGQFQTLTIPTQPQQFHMNLWGADPSWGPGPGDPNGPPVGDPNFKPVLSASANHAYFFDVANVKVEQLSAPTLGAVANDSTPPSGLVVSNDVYVTTAGHALTAVPTASVLSNDSSSVPEHASLVSGPSHGTLNLASDGTFTYTPNSGFTGIDSFSYQTTDDSGAIGNSVALIDVAPTKVGAITTLDFASLSPSEQVATVYDALLGRGADLAGFNYWLQQQYGGISQKGALASTQDIANAFAGSDEAKAIYPLLANPKAATDAQVVSFVDSVYQNLFGRTADAGGEAYWAGQIKQAIAAGQSVGSFVVTVANGAQGNDITALLNKAQVNLEYVNQQNALQTTWSPTTDQSAAAALVAAVTADAHTALVGIKQADNLILADVH